MKEQRLEFDEFLPDQQTLLGGASVAHNCYASAMGYLPISSFQAFSNAMEGAPLGAISVVSGSGLNEVYAGTAAKLYKIGSTVDDRSKAGGYTLSTLDKWEFAKFGDRLIATGFSDPVQYLDFPSGSNDFADLAGSPPKARHIAVVRDFVVLGNIDDAVDGERPERVHWSGFNDSEEWTVGTNQSDFQEILGGGGAVQRIFGGEYGVIIQQNAITRMQYIGGDLVFQFDQVESERGTLVPGGCVQYGRSIFYIGHDGFYELRDGVQSVPIGSEKVDRYFLEDFDSSYQGSVTCAVDPVRSLVVWSYPGADNVDGVANKAIIYNWETQKWSTAELGATHVFRASTVALTLEELDDLGDLESLPYPLDSSVYKGGNLLMGGFDSSYRFGYFDGAALTARIDTKELRGSRQITVTRARPQVQGNGDTSVTIGVGSRNSATETPSFSTQKAPNATGVVNLRSKGRYQRIRCEISGGFEHAAVVDVEYREAGKR